jgi:hypothetical protein
MKHPLLITLTLLLAFAQLSAQSPYEILTIPDGVCAVNTRMSMGEVHFFVTDDSLEKTFEGTLNLPQHIRKVLHHAKDEMVYFLFNYGSSQNYEKILLTIHTKTGETETFTVPAITSFIDDFRILGNRIAMISHYESTQAYIQFATLDDENPDPATFHLHHRVLDISETEGYLDVLALTNAPKGPGQLQLMTFNELGEKLYTIEAESPNRKSPFIQSAQFIESEDGDFKVVGTYSKSEKDNFLGYFYWDIDQSLSQNFNLFPYTSLESLSKEKKGKLKKQIKYELSKGFEIVKISMEDDKITLIAVPSMDTYLKRYPKVFNRNLFHIMHMDKNGGLLEEKIFAFSRSLRSNHITRDFLYNPPLYNIDGSLYFLHNEEFTESPGLIIHNISTDLASKVDAQLPQNLQEDVLFYQTKQWKNKEILVFGLKEKKASRDKSITFFLEKMQVH